ncbi:MAG: hypothetical protein H7Z42_22085 [Roseiflexaceae bacterium]|nr:hypothetical protein [Roseiflexaceae bacterium]
MPRISASAIPPNAPRGDFVGREAEQREFCESVQLLLAHQPTQSGDRI